MSLPLVHAGHWIEGAIFALPVLAVVVLVFGDSVRERRRRGRRR